MTTTLNIGDKFPDVELPNHESDRVKLSSFTQPGLVDHYLGFTDGYPLILVFYRGFSAQEIVSNCLNWCSSRVS